MKFFFQVTQLLQSALAAVRLLGGRAGWDYRLGFLRSWSWGAEPNPADVEVFLEAIRLEQIGQLKGADIAAGMPDFLLQQTRKLMV